jgi:prepilin peptidase CpaA
MAPNLFASEIVLVVTAAVLLYAAHNDFRRYKIRNELIIALAILFFVHSLVSGRWSGVYWNIAFAVLMFAVMLPLYARHLMGGGDVKLLSVAFLWVGLDCAMLFAVLMLVFAGAHALAARLGWVGVARAEDDVRPRIPFAPAIAAALIGVFMLGCLGLRS